MSYYSKPDTQRPRKWLEHHEREPRVAELVLAAVADSIGRWEDGASLDEIIDDVRREIPPQPASATASALYAYFRNRRIVCGLIEQLAERPPPVDMRRILTASLAVGLFHSSVSKAVVASVSVEMSKRVGGAATAGFINAVLRKAFDRTADEWRARLFKDNLPPGVPLALVDRWRRWMEPRELDSILDAFAAPPHNPAIRVLSRSDALDEAGCVPMPPFPFAPGLEFMRVPDMRKLLDADGRLIPGVYVQDPATAMAPCLFSGDGPPCDAMDACAAPGGKTLILASRLPKGSRIWACDRSPARAAMLADNLARLSAKDVCVQAADMAKPPFPSESMDKILLDVPCSNTAVARSRPDALWRLDDIQRLRELAAVQARLLLGCAPLLRPGGEMVYSTCSLEREENEAAIAAFLESPAGAAFQLVAERRLLPTPDHDGAYAALLRKSTAA